MPAKVKTYVIATGEVVSESAESVQSQGFRKYMYYLWRKGFRYTVQANHTNEYSEKFNKDLYLFGGRYQITSFNEGDYLEFEVVDLDNVLGYGAGVVLSRYIETEHIETTNAVEIKLDDAALLPVGVYIRARLVSVGAAAGQLKVKYYLRTSNAQT